jgi:hypothetical protein
MYANKEEHNAPTLVTTMAKKALNSTVALWFVVAVSGQWLFAYYIAVFYGGTALEGNFIAWTKNMIHGFVDGDYMGNAFVLLHILLAFFITVGGPLQLIPSIRKHFPTFHRINGRVYIFTAIFISLGGLYMTWSRSADVGGFFGQITLTMNALLIILFAIQTIRTALAGNFESHRRWALRTFLVVGGVWFFRVGFGLWILLNGGTAPGSTANLTGPFDMTLYLSQFLVPLLFLELYFYVQQKGGTKSTWGMAMLMFTLSILLGLGIFMASQIFWLPNLR